MLKKLQQAFTLVELLVTIAIIGILAAIAVPSYTAHRNKALFTEVIQAAQGYQSAVAGCMTQNTNLSPTGCNEGTNGIPPAMTSDANSKVIDTVTVTDGVITATPKAVGGIAATHTYILNPVVRADLQGVSFQVDPASGVCGQGIIGDC